jgi:hypothetical protein
MLFSSDRQRRAVFAQLRGSSNSGFSSSDIKFSFPPREVLSTAPKYVFDEKPVDQFSMRSDYEGIIKGLRRVEINPGFAPELREKARIEREKAERNLEKFGGKDELEITVPKEVTQEEMESYMRRHGLTSVPDPVLVAEEDAEFEALKRGGVVLYRTAPDSYEDYQKYLLDETKRLESQKKQGVSLGSYVTEEKPVFSKKSAEEKADLVKENIGDKLQKEFAGRLPDSFVMGVDWYGIADPKLSLAENRKKVEKDFELFLDSKFSERDDELWEKVMATREKQRVKAGSSDILDIAEEFEPPFRAQVIKDLKVYPMHDAIAMWIDSADSLDDKSYGKVKNVANKFIANVEEGKFEKVGVKHKSKSKHMMDKTEREEARMEDPSKGTDPDYLKSEEEMREELEYDPRYEAGYLD